MNRHTFSSLFTFVFLSLSAFTMTQAETVQNAVRNLDENGKLPRASAESQGISSEVLIRLTERLRDEVNSPNSLMVLRHGKVIAECWWAPHSPETTHALYSLSKSFTSTATGFAVSEGKLSLDDKVVDIFAEDLPADFNDPASAEKYALLKKATLRDLLTMSGGQEREPGLKGLFPLDFSRPEPGDCWEKEFFAQPFLHEPGTRFLYNTAGTYMVSSAVQKAVGESIRDYLVPRLFQPLAIETPFWESSPDGVSKGGTGLFLHTEDVAKFGQFCLQRGMWNGKQLLPAEWVDMATRAHVSNGTDPNSDWAQGYGFQFWRCRFSVYRGDGMFCQFMIVIPEKDVVVAITSDCNNYQQVVNVVFEELLPEHINPERRKSVFQDEPLPENVAAVARLKELAASLTAKEGASGSVVMENVHLPSKILGRDTTFYVYLPNGYLTSGFQYPVMYLLHGGGDIGDAWVKKGDLKRIADEYFNGRAEKAIIVMPYCEDARWRNDFEGKYRYEDYFVQELIPFVESNFRCRQDRQWRAVAGLSRGGYGSLLYSIRHPELFGTCFAMSPAIRPHELIQNMSEEEFLRLYRTCVAPNHKDGDERLTEFFFDHDILTLVKQMPDAQKNAVRYFIDCGDDDYLGSGTTLLHLEMLKKGVPHELRIRDGAHNWEYWKVSLPMALGYFLEGKK